MGELLSEIMCQQCYFRKLHSQLVFGPQHAKAGDAEMWVDPWVWKIPLEKGLATQFSILTVENPMDREPDRPQSIGSPHRDTTEANLSCTCVQAYFYKNVKG